MYKINSEFALPAVQMRCVRLHYGMGKKWWLINKIRYTVTLSYRSV